MIDIQRFPLRVLEASRVVHYMEAVPACPAIIVRYFYRVIYDPDIYPMNTAWITGRHKLRNGVNETRDDDVDKTWSADLLAKPLIQALRDGQEVELSLWLLHNAHSDTDEPVEFLTLLSGEQ